MIHRFLGLLAFFFPFALPFTKAQKAEQKALEDATRRLIDSAKWDKSPGNVLDQANRIMDGELERRKSAEGKASTYLAVLAALVPVTLSIEAAEWDHKTGPAPEWLRIAILIVAVIYTAAAGWFAFRALRVTGVHVIGVYDLAKAWQGAEGQRKLAESTARHIFASQTAINDKVTLIKVTHAHLIRAFLLFILLLLIDPVAFQFRALGIIAARKVECGAGAAEPAPAVPASPGSCVPAAGRPPVRATPVARRPQPKPAALPQPKF